MKLAYVELCGFRGYRESLRIDFPDGFTIIDGRNGAGKSTIFDAIEFALTGRIAKYGDATADRETVADYIWWRGEGRVPSDHYVEIGFRDHNSSMLVVRRTHLAKADPQGLHAVLEGLCDIKVAPREPLPQLCAASIIRDEHIATFSLDLKETERYSRLHEAIGATDADAWIERSLRLSGIASKRVHAARAEVEEAARTVAAVALRIDGIRASLVEEATLGAAIARLQLFTGSTAAPDQLSDPARAAIAEKSRQLDQVTGLEELWQKVVAARLQLQQLRGAVASAQTEKDRADAAYTAIAAEGQSQPGSDATAQEARDVAALVILGQKLGLRDGHCPLCSSERTTSEFARGLALAEEYARRLDRQAVEQERREQATKAAAAARSVAGVELEKRKESLQERQDTIGEFERRLAVADLAPAVGIDEIRGRNQALRAQLEKARDDLRIVETLKLNAMLEKAVREGPEAKLTYARAEARLGLARRAESRAHDLHDATRRAAFETVNRRLERVLPLMVELYQRLRPHPIWVDIEYKIRGDLRRFLKLQVGNDLNPQFFFSSGQRRATGLAFLLSVNLSLAWSRWRTILLDDPVQHIDDFRSIHLAEVLAQLSESGRQIICAVEDAALADLLCRRLPIGEAGNGKRVTLGTDPEGALTKLQEQELEPLLQRALVAPSRLAG